MSSFIITSSTNSFTVSVNGIIERHSRNDFRNQIAEDDPNKIFIYLKEEKRIIYNIDLARDTVDVNGVTVWADAAALDTVLEPIFFLEETGGSGGGSVDSVTGPFVNNADTANPIVEEPTSNQVVNTSSVAGATVTDALNNLTMPTPTARIVLAAGATNMIGVESADDLRGNLIKYRGFQERVMIWNGAAFDNLEVSVNNDFPNFLNVFGPTISACIDLSEAKNETIYLVLYAEDNARLADRGTTDTWDINSSIGYYPKFRDNFQNAFSYLQGLGLAPFYDCFLWDQGEPDSSVSTEANAYETNLTALVSQVRTDTNVLDLYTIIALQYFTFTTFTLTDVVRNAKLNFVKNDGGNSVAFDTDFLPQSGDNITRSRIGSMLEGRVFEALCLRQYLTYDPFAGTTADGFPIDTSQWNVTETTRVNIEQNNGLVYTPQGTQNQVSSLANTVIDINSVTTEGTLAVQAIVDWETPSLSGERNAGFGIYADQQNYAIIGTTPTGGVTLGAYRILVFENGLQKHLLLTEVQKGKLIYVTYNSFGKQVTFEYWDEVTSQRVLIAEFNTNLTVTTQNLQGFSYCNDHITRTGCTEFKINEYYSANTRQASYVPTNASSISESREQGFIDYNDTTGAVTLTANTWTTIPNNGAGAFTNKQYKPYGVSEFLDVLTGAIDVNEISLGDTILIRNDFEVNPNTNNALLEFRYQLGSGGNIYTLETTIGRLDDGSGKDYRFSLKPDLIYMGDTNTKDSPIILQVRLSTNGVLNNAGSVIQLIKR